MLCPKKQEACEIRLEKTRTELITYCSLSDIEHCLTFIAWDLRRCAIEAHMSDPHGKTNAKNAKTHGALKCRITSPQGIAQG